MNQPSLNYILEDQWLMSAAINYLAWQSRLVTRELGRRVVEIGCGVGNFTAMLLDREVVISLDVEPRCVELLRARYPGRQNLCALRCDPLEPDFRRTAEYHPDSCVCLNVLEHIEDDLGALDAMQSILKPGGVIVLIVPAFSALYGPIDRNLGHHRRYRRRDIRRLANRLGLQIEKLHYMNVAGFFGWWWNARVLKRQTQSARQIRFFDRYIVPVMSPAEGILKPLFGQSLFAVLKKPGHLPRGDSPAAPG